MVDSFHFNISICKRGKGKSAVASAEYISCENIKNEWDGVTHKYENKKGLLYSEMFLPDHVPIEFKDRKFLWNSVELNEKAINSQLARNFIISLQQRICKKQELYTSYTKKSRSDSIRPGLTTALYPLVLP